MADKKKEVKEAQKAGESIVAKKFASDATSKNASSNTTSDDTSKNASSNTTSDDTRKDMFSMDYEAAKQKYGQGQGNNIYFMSKNQFEKSKEEYLKNATTDNKNATTDTSLVDKKFAEQKGKTWADVKAENGNDPAKIADYMNNNPDYKPGELTNKGMAEMGYKQGEDGKWTIDKVLDEIDSISGSDKKIETAVQGFTNPETGEVDEEKTNDAINKYEQRLVELGAATYDMDGNFILKPTSEGKGWETWATLLSVGLSVIGISMGVPIIPINFRAVTGKDARDAQIQALQTQYMNIKSDSAKTIEQMNADVEAGKIAQKNQDALAAQEKHAQATAATKDVINAQTTAEKELIETRTTAEIRKDEAQFNLDMQRLKANQDFELKYEALMQQYKTEMAQLTDALTTKSALTVMKYQNGGFIEDLKKLGISASDLATYTASQNGISPSDKTWNRVKQVSDMLNNTMSAAGDFLHGKKD